VSARGADEAAKGPCLGLEGDGREVLEAVVAVPVLVRGVAVVAVVEVVVVVAVITAAVPSPNAPSPSMGCPSPSMSLLYALPDGAQTAAVDACAGDSGVGCRGERNDQVVAREGKCGARGQRLVEVWGMDGRTRGRCRFPRWSVNMTKERTRVRARGRKSLLDWLFA